MIWVQKVQRVAPTSAWGQGMGCGTQGVGPSCNLVPGGSAPAFVLVACKYFQLAHTMDNVAANLALAATVSCHVMA